MDSKKLNYFDIGHIYIIEDNFRGLIKIGCSANPKDRIKVILNSSAAKGRTFISHKIANRFYIEKMMHNHFSKNKVLSEWFKVDFETAKSKLLTILPQQITNVQIENCLKEKNLQLEKALKGIADKFDNHFKESAKNLEDYYFDAAGYLSDILVFIKNMHKMILTCRPSETELVKSEFLHSETINCMEKSISNISILYATYISDLNLMNQKQRTVFREKLKSNLDREN